MNLKFYSIIFICEILLSNYLVFGITSGENCGKSKFNQSPILSGSHISRGAFPWNAALMFMNGEFFCSGTLISSNQVVTAAGCIAPKQSDKPYQPQDIAVALGSHNLGDLFEVGRLLAAVKSIRVHNDWNTQTDSFDADIAVLELESNVNFSTFIQPICLMESDSDVASVTNASIVGFGVTSTGVEKIPRILDTPIVSFDKCSQDEGYTGLLSNRMICGGLADGTGPCFGDGGTGMIVEKDGVYYLRGITSATLINAQGCNNNAHSVFTDVLKFKDWMKGV